MTVKAITHLRRSSARRRRMLSLAVTVFGLVWLLAIAPDNTGAADPTFYPREAQNFIDSFGRFTDQLSNPAYDGYRVGDAGITAGDQFRGSPSGLENAGDPLRRVGVWDIKRGHVLGISYKNRYGATIRGDLWSPLLPFIDPVTGTSTSGPLPAVILVNGLGTASFFYRWAAEGLAESGYLVMSFDPQGVYSSDTEPDPKSVYCDPDPNASWRQPQEMGFQEQGPCAGESSCSNQLTPDFLVSLLQYREGATIDLQESYEFCVAPYVFGALDAVKWLLSTDNPWRGLVDTTRIGAAGHSEGAFTAMMVANGDPLHRFIAGVAWDGYANLSHGVTANVPTQFQQAEQEALIGPHLTPPDPQSLHTTRTSYAAFQNSCVDSMFEVLRSSGHSEYVYSGFEDLPGGAASRTGERVAMYFTLAWFDRYLKGASTAFTRGDESAQAADALARLTGATFDGSADRSSIGIGHWDPTTQKNMPYMIENDAVADHLSFLYSSSSSLGACN